MKPRILVVDDDTQLRRFITARLLAWGYEPVPAADGHEALVSIREFMPVAIIVDVNLPGISGVRLLESVKSQAEWRDVPMIGISGYDLPDDEARLFTAFLSKPFEADQLLSIMHRLVPLPPGSD